MSSKADIGVIGMAVMGQNIALNMDSKGFVVCVFNRDVGKVETFLKTKAKGTRIRGVDNLKDLVEMLNKPRIIMLLVKAGTPVDGLISSLLKYLEDDDLIVDGGNSDYVDTARRCREMRENGKYFIGCGVSGGEEGARNGPSLMPGGHPEAWPYVQPIFQKICAQVNGEPCCDWVGEGGSGHFVKMIHNGIEYGDMQLICEAYHIMKSLGISQDDMANYFENWNKEELNSFLIEITAKILRYRDENGGYLLDRIRDTASQKGTGRWTAVAALQYEMPVTLIGEAVYARYLSMLKQDRTNASRFLKGPTSGPHVADLPKFLTDIKYALYCAKIVSYAQGFMLLRTAAKENHWNLNYGGIAMMWRGGCIIRSAFLENIAAAYDMNMHLKNMLLDSFFRGEFENHQSSWRRVVANAVLWGIPVPCLSSGLSFYDGYRRETLPANLIQALRDFFGAHGYELINNEGTFFHTDWTGSDGTVQIEVYQG